MKKKIYGNLIILMSIVQLSFGQETKPLFEQLLEERKNSIEALVLYPAETRRAILEICQHPGALVKIDRIQGKSSEAFKQIIKDLFRKEQEQLYELIRYPNLLNRLVEGGRKSKEEITAILQDYPQQIHNAALKRGRNSYSILVKLQGLNEETEQAFDALLAEYDPEIRGFIQELISHPEILTILTEDLDMAILVGDAYRKHPKIVLHKADSLQELIASEQTRELEEWKKELENDPRTLAELDNAGREFARDNDYNLKGAPGDELDVKVHFYPYSYWFGYPHWYSYPYWYPYPYWYHTGFYYSNNGALIVIGLPSFHYTTWFYNYPRRYYYLDRHYWRHYERYPNSRSSFRRGVRISRHTAGNQIIRQPRRTHPIGNERGNTTIRIPQRSSRSYQRQRANDHHRSTWQPRSKVQSRTSRSQRRPTSTRGSRSRTGRNE